jgi:predicted PurR-regulated permease PerM
MKKQIPALFATLFIMIFLLLAMGVTGVTALTNKNGTLNTNSSSVAIATTTDKALIDQLQFRINEYANRENQFQQLLQEDQTKLQQFENQNQQVQQLLYALQVNGLIRIGNDGTLTITGHSGD